MELQGNPGNQFQEKLRLKQVEETKAKEERIEKGKQQFEAWNKKREDEIKVRKEKNAKTQKAKKESKDGNAWEKVLANVDESGLYPGKKDVGRMKEVMIGRKKDYKQ